MNLVLLFFSLSISRETKVFVSLATHLCPMGSSYTTKAMAGVKKKKRSAPTYASYIHKILQQVAPKEVTGVTVSSKSIQLLHMVLSDLEKRVADKAFSLAAFDKKSTLGEKHVRTAVGIVIPPELAGHTNREMGKAMAKYVAVA